MKHAICGWLLGIVLAASVVCGGQQPQKPPDNSFPQYPVIPFLAQKPNGQWSFIEVDSTGGLVGAGAGFVLTGQQPPDTSFPLYPYPVLAQDPSGNWQFLQVDGTGALKTTGSGGAGNVTHTGNLTSGQVVIGNGSADITVLPGGTTPASVPEFLTETPSGGVAGAATYNLSGVVPRASTCTANADTILATDRAGYVTESDASACAVTLPQAGTAGFASNFMYVTCDIGAGAATITPTTSTISYASGSGYTSAASSMALTTGQCAVIYSDNTNYFAIQFTAGGGALPTGLTFVSPTFTISSATNGNAVLALSGNTSGTATFTAPAVAGTRSNPVVSTNALALPTGSLSVPPLLFGTSSTTWFYQPNAGEIDVAVATGGATAQAFNHVANGDLQLVTGGSFRWSNSATNATTTQDTGVGRVSAGLVSIDTTSNGAAQGKLKAAGFISGGTKFTTNNGCTDSATAGGATAGTFTVGSTSCTEVITMGNSATAPNGWSCTVVDITTLGDVTNPHQTTSNTTTATIVTGTVVSGDQIQFSCLGY